jgi:hypothetical protein
LQPSSPTSGIIGGAIAGGIQGGNLQSALTGGITGGVFAEVGNIAAGLPKTIEGAVESASLHAVAGGLTSVIRGGDFKSGFLSAGFTDLAGPAISRLELGARFNRSRRNGK